MTNDSKNPIFCAIDTTDLDKAKQLISAIRPHVGGVKLGLEFFAANGMKGVLEIEKLNIPIFLDLKFHDIPNTVAGAIRALHNIESMFMLTVHAAGGKAMMEAALKAAEIPYKRRPLVVGVTVLTSLDAPDLSSVGVGSTIQDQATRLAALAKKSGLDGVVCSPHEVAELRKIHGEHFKLVVPGIRPVAHTPSNYLLHAMLGTTETTANIKNDDQKRVMTPKEALDLGATYLVIGRPITDAADPAKAAADILATL